MVCTRKRVKQREQPSFQGRSEFLLYRSTFCSLSPSRVFIRRFRIIGNRRNAVPSFLSASPGNRSSDRNRGTRLTVVYRRKWWKRTRGDDGRWERGRRGGMAGSRGWTGRGASSEEETERYEAPKLFHFNNYEPEWNTAWTDCKFTRFAILIAIGCLHK